MLVPSLRLCVAALCLFASSTAVPVPDDSANVLDNPLNWQFQGASLSVARSRIAAASAGHYALFGGGYLQNETYTDIVDIYHRTTNKWSTAHLSSTRSSVSAGSVGDRYPVTTVDVYDTSNDSWSTLQLTVPRASPKIINLGSQTAIVGGLSGDLQYLSSAVDFIDHDLKITAAKLDVNYPQYGFAAGDRSGTGLFTGGYENQKPGERFNDFQASNQTSILKASGKPEISRGPLFPDPRWGAGSAAANGVFVFGGGHKFTETDTVVSDRVDVFSLKTNSWCSPVSLSTARDYPVTHAIGDYIVFVDGTVLTKDFDVFDTRTLKFVKNDKHKPALYTHRTDAGSTVVDDCLLIIAGGDVYQGRNVTGSVELFNACKH
ncbi:hypothetical protein DL89DRAFT_293842 [Linderina pennispora]|uniref:Galactose oxidase n=1 Tax=Linderina pennispora TaxID=61395 RepID=A0A1Y1W509_9FUNG|nr:uncharacterized protein DL89DRAFT_293842 [Linderina pennispora]ORX68619.1 hypothetical protein DL89DRAFT_293842 [Linderina pennispora]